MSKRRVTRLGDRYTARLFDTMVLPMLNYACKVWGVANNDVLETELLTFCKYILSLNKFTPKWLYLERDPGL